MAENKCNHKFVNVKAFMNKYQETLWIYCEKCGETERLY